MTPMVSTAYGVQDSRNVVVTMIDTRTIFCDVRSTVAKPYELTVSLRSMV